MSDLFDFNIKKQKENAYTAEDIAVLEGLEPVRMRPGMYIGGTDLSAMHHLVSEILDNAMDEAVAGFASKITIKMLDNGYISISDNGRGIPIDNHPKFPDKSALEVILTTLHSGGKFSDKSYQTSGGLHGVGISVVNALSESLTVEVYRDGTLYTQKYSKGLPLTPLEKSPTLKKHKGTKITFLSDTTIFGISAKFQPKRIYDLAKSKAYLYKGVEIYWFCAPEIIDSGEVPENDVIHFPGGLQDYLYTHLDKNKIIGGKIFAGVGEVTAANIRVEWAIAWDEDKEFVKSYCNTIPTTMGGTHEQGVKAALLRSVKIYGEMTSHKKVIQIIPDDILHSACIMLSVFIKNPVFQGQTKEKLVSNDVAKHLQNIIKDHFDHWLSNDRESSNKLIQHFINIAEYRLSRKNERNVKRKTAVQKLRLPGKLVDCSSTSSSGTELFLVEGDSAGGSAKQARDRYTQAILPLRGKILNVANSTLQKIQANQEIQDLEIALNCGSLNNYCEESLRYEKVIIMTDADVDGAHIASLLMTFFYIRMPQLITNGHLYLAQPPLYRLTQGAKTYYASNEKQKDKIFEQLSKNKQIIDVGRFKGLGEMTPKQLKQTTMEQNTRSIYKINIDDFENTGIIVENLMGKKPEKRFQFIQEEALIKTKTGIKFYV